MRTNNKAFKQQSDMNKTLLKILQRYELDKPILMSDKLDCIWDKKDQPSTSTSPQKSVQDRNTEQVT